MTFYAHYLQTRITAYKELKHDVVRVQAENNRASIYRNQTEGVSGQSVSVHPFERPSHRLSRIVWVYHFDAERARKLKSLTVEKGLLRETQQVQKVIDSLVKCEVSPTGKRFVWVIYSRRLIHVGLNHIVLFTSRSG